MEGGWRGGVREGRIEGVGEETYDTERSKWVLEERRTFFYSYN